jgi:hypothetical protein
VYGRFMEQKTLVPSINYVGHHPLHYFSRVQSISDFIVFFLSPFLASTAQLRPWPPPQNSAEFLGGFSTIFFFRG